MYSRSLHHSGDFELLRSSPFFCASKHLNSKSDASLKPDLVWAFLKALFSAFSSVLTKILLLCLPQQKCNPMSLTLLLTERLVYLVFCAYLDAF